MWLYMVLLAQLYLIGTTPFKVSQGTSSMQAGSPAKPRQKKRKSPLPKAGCSPKKMARRSSYGEDRRRSDDEVDAIVALEQIKNAGLWFTEHPALHESSFAASKCKAGMPSGVQLIETEPLQRSKFADHSCTNGSDAGQQPRASLIRSLQVLPY